MRGSFWCTSLFSCASGYFQISAETLQMKVWLTLKIHSSLSQKRDGTCIIDGESSLENERIKMCTI